MSKFNRSVKPAKTGILATTGESTVNADGFKAYVRDVKSELFLAGVGAFYGEDKFYAKGDAEADRFRALVRKAATEDAEWTAAFLRWLRSKANIRTAALVGAAEYVAAGAPNGRALVNAVIQRADEPGEVIAYWLATKGRNVPQPVKRGVRDAVERLYTQTAVAKWDSSKAGVRFADVVELVHPRPTDTYQGDLFRYLLEDRRNRATFEGKNLQWLEARANALHSENPREALLAQLAEGNRTVTWETASAAGTGKMSADQWKTMYGHMGYMARLRNLRNLDEAGVTTAFKHEVGRQLADPEEVAKSRQLPMRFLSAYSAAPSLVWGEYLSEALDHSLANVPTLPGRWLVLVDASGSMQSPYSKHGEMSYYAAATVFAAAFARKNDTVIRTYSGGWYGHGDVLSPEFPQRKGESTMATVARFADRTYWIGGGTDTAGALRGAFDASRFDRVLLITDEQYNGYGDEPSKAIPANVPLYIANIAGYRGAQQAADFNRVTVGGLSDAMFSMLASVEGARGGKWPWEQ